MVRWLLLMLSSLCIRWLLLLVRLLLILLLRLLLLLLLLLLLFLRLTLLPPSPDPGQQVLFASRSSFLALA